jgi:hypothetical protein
MSSSSFLSLDLKTLKNGEIPESMFFTSNPKEPMDLEKVRYNTFYKSIDFYKNKFPEGAENATYLTPIFEEMASSSLSPLETMEERHRRALISPPTTNEFESLHSTDVGIQGCENTEEDDGKTRVLSQ